MKDTIPNPAGMKDGISSLWKSDLHLILTPHPYCTCETNTATTLLTYTILHIAPSPYTTSAY
jgi:hypothetical protein